MGKRFFTGLTGYKEDKNKTITNIKLYFNVHIEHWIK